MVVVILTVMATTLVVALGFLKNQNDTLVRLLDDERSRSRELLTLVESQRAPAEYAAWAAPAYEEDALRYEFDDTGLISYVVEDDDG